MKTYTPMIFFILGCFLLANAADGPNYSHFWKNSDYCLDHLDLYLDGNSLIIQSLDEEANRVEITADGRIFIKDEEIKLNSRQKKLVKAYHKNGMNLIKNSQKLGYKGVKIGIRGASLGIKAVAGIAEAVFTEYELKDLEKDLEKEAERLEEEAEKLENEAELLEELGDQLEEMHFKLKRNIEKLQELEWF
jgi:hypothetical protein